MKSIIIVSVFFLGSICATGQAVYKYETEKVTEDIYVLKPLINDYRWVTANIVVIVNSEDVLVVDSGLLPEAGTEAVKEIKKITNKPVKFLLNTHWHGDHWQGNESFAKAYPGIEFIAAEQGFHAILRNGMMWINTFYPKYLQGMVDSYEEAVKRGQLGEGKPLTPEGMKYLSEGLNQVKQDLASVKTIKPTVPTFTFTDKFIMRRGGREFQFYYLGIGNTVGDAVLYLPKEKVLIPGDLVVYPSPYESGAFSKEWVETSKKLAQFEFKYLIPGHGAVQKDYSYLNYLNALFAEVSKQTNAVYLSGKNSADDAVKIVTAESVVAELNKTPEYAQYTKYLDPGFVRSAVQNTFKRAIEGKL